MRLIKILLIVFPFLNGIEETAHINAEDKSLFVCYGKIDPNTIKGYKLVVIESEHYNRDEIKTLKNNNAKVVAYISLTEVNEYSLLFEKLKPYSRGKNNNWGSYFIDISKKPAREILLNRINEIADKGFDGLFMDNLDNVSQWGALRTEEESLGQLLYAIRENHQQFYLCQNSGLFLNDQIMKLTDAIVIESLVTNYDFAQQKYMLRDRDSKRQLMSAIQKTKKLHKKPIYILEYTDNLETMQSVSKELSSYKLPYYIAQINLQLPSIFLNTNK